MDLAGALAWTVWVSLERDIRWDEQATLSAAKARRVNLNDIFEENDFAF